MFPCYRTLSRRAAWVLAIFVYFSIVSTTRMDVAYPALPAWFVELWRWVVTF